MTQHVGPRRARDEMDGDRVDSDRVDGDRAGGFPADHTDVWLPQQARSSEHSGPIPMPRPFARGSVLDEQTVPAPRTSSGTGLLTPPRPAEPTAAPPRAPRRGRTTLLVVGGVLAVILLLCGLYAASVTREASPEASQVAPVAGLRDVTYTVTTAHGSPVVVSYSRSTSGEYAVGSASDASSPWHVAEKVNDYYGPSLSATVVGDQGDAITCTIVENGRTVAQATQSGPGASVSCLP